MTHAPHSELPAPPRVWPTLRERFAWAKHETGELHKWRKTAAEGMLPVVASLVLLRHFLAPQDWKEEAIIGVVSLVAGLIVVPITRFALNYLWHAPRHFTQARFVETWYDRWSLQQERQRLLAEARERLLIDVEIGGGPFVRPASLPGSTPERDGRVYALQSVVITNRSDSNVSLSFELWLPWAKGDAMLMIREHEYSGLGRTDARYAKSPLNIGPRASSECKDIGFLLMPGHDDFFGKEIEYDLNRAVLRVIDRVSKKQLDVPVRRSMSEPLRPPGWPVWP